ncbi:MULTISPECIES: MFS transporter [Neobacillus]|uniref:Glycoside-pentoside-hexuronide (GPH):cation symporter n=1 Tax=Neobacillus rhizophilus TaxID=2833579 RepID=A0A942UCH5_9BACI|nr:MULTISPECIES: glycoside-pentoside-hexuronide (GPH):cation symporter [Neobacillus]MBS4216153.1 glycoside-pentoside-hexuronide (GPH):cation symporter [Neobacillus rhizophilus]MBU8917286.1 glycoside-pentoside-hexuronide (GPH):cation symporter [Bacillus sp. FJAT-29953]
MKKFGVRDQVGYALGDIGGSFVNLYIGGFFLIFCTYVLGVSPYFMGTMFLLGKFFDAICNVVMGTLPDRWKLGKSGDKFLPYINISKWILAASCLLAFANVSSWGSAATHIWVVFIYLFFCVAYTADSIPYGSLASVITNDPVERTKLSRARAIGGMVVGLGFLSFVPMFIYDKAGKVVPEAFFQIAIVFSILSVLAYTGLVKLSTERIRDENGPGTNSDYQFKDAFMVAIKNRPLIGMMVASIGSLLMINGVSQLAPIVFAERYHMPSAFAINSFISIGITLVLFAIVPKLVVKFNKRNLVIATAFFSLAASLVLTLVTIENVYVFMVLYNLATIGSAVFVMVVWALVTDCIDYAELQTGKHYEGTLYSLYSFARKVGMGLGSAIGSYALGWVGFVSGAKSQSPAVAEGVAKMYTGMPVLAFILILIGVGLIYNLNAKRTNEMYAALKERRAS